MEIRKRKKEIDGRRLRKKKKKKKKNRVGLKGMVT